jgi:hypothetical protein
MAKPTITTTSATRPMTTPLKVCRARRCWRWASNRAWRVGEMPARLTTEFGALAGGVRLATGRLAGAFVPTGRLGVAAFAASGWPSFAFASTGWLAVADLAVTGRLAVPDFVPWPGAPGVFGLLAFVPVAALGRLLGVVRPPLFDEAMWDTNPPRCSAARIVRSIRLSRASRNKVAQIDAPLPLASRPPVWYTASVPSHEANPGDAGDRQVGAGIDCRSRCWCPPSLNCQQTIAAKPQPQLAFAA